MICVKECDAVLCNYVFYTLKLGWNWVVNKTYKHTHANNLCDICMKCVEYDSD